MLSQVMVENVGEVFFETQCSTAAATTTALSCCLINNFSIVATH